MTSCLQTSRRGCQGLYKHSLSSLSDLTCVPFQETKQLKNKSMPVSYTAPQARLLPEVVNRAKPFVRGLPGLDSSAMDIGTGWGRVAATGMRCRSAPWNHEKFMATGSHEA